jgi:KDO2-lipid IV(A) lauroyltransferase
VTLAQTISARLTDLEYAAAWRLVRALPEPVALGAFRLGADLAARRGGTGARQLRANLRRAAPGADLDVLVRDGLRSYARYWCEAFRLPSMDPADVHARTRVTGPGPFAEALDDGRGVVLALVHSGNWDAAGVWLVETLRRRGLEPSFTTVAQRLAPESVYRRFVAYREALGFEVVAAEGGSATHRALTSRLRSGGVVCLLADRDVTGTGAEVSFLGAPTTMPTGPARLAALTGALLLPTHACFTPDGWSLDFADPVPVPGRADVGRHDVGGATQALADAFGVLVSRAPADWHVLQPIWREP